MPRKLENALISSTVHMNNSVTCKKNTKYLQMNQKLLKTLYLEKILQFFHLLLYFGTFRLISSNFFITHDALRPRPFSYA